MKIESQQLQTEPQKTQLQSQPKTKKELDNLVQDLESLIVVVQRYPRYSLFLDRLLKSVDCCECNESIKDIKQKLKKVNQSLNKTSIQQDSNEPKEVMKVDEQCSKECTMKRSDKDDEVKFVVEEIKKTEEKFINQLKANSEKLTKLGSNQSAGSSGVKDVNITSLKYDVMNILKNIIGGNLLRSNTETDPKNITDCCNIPKNKEQQNLCSKNILDGRKRFGTKEIDNKYFPSMVKKKFADCLLEKINTNYKLKVYIDIFKNMSKTIYNAFNLNEIINNLYDLYDLQKKESSEIDLHMLEVKVKQGMIQEILSDNKAKQNLQNTFREILQKLKLNIQNLIQKHETFYNSITSTYSSNIETIKHICSKIKNTIDVESIKNFTMNYEIYQDFISNPTIKK